MIKIYLKYLITFSLLYDFFWVIIALFFLEPGECETILKTSLIAFVCAVLGTIGIQILKRK